jgi:hypothetical protein
MKIGKIGADGQSITSDLEEELFIRGFEYSWEDWLQYDNDEEKIIVFDPTNCSCSKIIFKPLLFYANAGPVPINIYTNVEYTAGSGTELSQSNRNELSENVSEAILRIGSAIELGFTGTKFAGDLIPANGAATPNAAGNQNFPVAKFRIDPDKIKAIGLTNTGPADTYIEHKLTWFEIPKGF